MEREHEEFVCQLCGSRHVGKRLLTMHLVDVHPEQVPDRVKERKILKGTCDECGRTFPNPHKYYGHWLDKHKVRGRTMTRAN